VKPDIPSPLPFTNLPVMFFRVLCLREVGLCKGGELRDCLLLCLLWDGERGGFPRDEGGVAETVERVALVGWEVCVCV
jgi:hypothetical protein